jgi:hypothetical protein
VRGSLLYMAACYWLFVLDVTLPTAPVQLGYCAVPHCGIAVDVEGTTAYVAAMESGLRIIDVSDPSVPVEIGFFMGPYNFASHVAVAGSLAFVVDGYVRVVDVSDPVAPVEIGTYAPPTGSANAIALDGDHAFVGATDSVRVLDITDPTTPVEVGSFPTGASSVTLSGSYLYVTGIATGSVRALDISDPTTPVEVGFYDPYPSGAREVGLQRECLHARPLPWVPCPHPLRDVRRRLRVRLDGGMGRHRALSRSPPGPPRAGEVTPSRPRSSCRPRAAWVEAGALPRAASRCDALPERISPIMLACSRHGSRHSPLASPCWRRWSSSFRCSSSAGRCHRSPPCSAIPPGARTGSSPRRPTPS